MQRKPWGNEPWDPEGVLRAQIECINTIGRRLDRDFPDLLRAVCADWARIRKQSTDWIRLPASYGGLGLLEFKGRIPGCNWPKPKHPDITFVNIDENSWRRFQQKYSDWNLTEQESKELQHIKLVQKTATDDISGLTHAFRKIYKLEVEKLGPQSWTEINLKLFPLKYFSGLAQHLRSLQTVEQFKHVITSVGADFGFAKRFEKWWGDEKDVAAVRPGTNLMVSLQAHAPEVFYKLKRLEKTGLHRSCALDYLFGSITGLVVGKLHPLMTSAVQSALSLAVHEWVFAGNKWSRPTWSWFTSVVASWFASELYSSQISLELFRW